MDKIVINEKPLSVNAAWQGRRFKTVTYKNYEQTIYHLLPKVKIKGEVEIHYTFYLKNYSRTDIDNCVKCLQDVIVKKGIIEDDRKIVLFSAEKRKSKTDRIEVEIMPYD
jgi:Holliday junction resolvase RusA-like endonuclease